MEISAPPYGPCGSRRTLLTRLLLFYLLTLSVINCLWLSDMQLEVKLDIVEFDASTSEYLDFLIIGCLHSLTSVHISPTSIILTSVKSSSFWHLGVPRRCPHRRQELATLPSCESQPLVTPISLCRFRD